MYSTRVGPWTKNGRKLYFHSFASMRESWVDTSILQNKSLFQQGLVDGTNKFFVSPEIRKTQSSVEVMTCDGVLIYASMDSSLSCWNSRNALTIENTHEMYKVIFKYKLFLYSFQSVNVSVFLQRFGFELL
jgi:hypothetical protein